jgi:hypothetical protein
MVHYITRNRILSADTALSVTVTICSVILLIEVTAECQLLLEIWIIWLMLMFSAIIFSFFTLDLKNDSFLSNSILINVAILHVSSRFSHE